VARVFVTETYGRIQRKNLFIFGHQRRRRKFVTVATVLAFTVLALDPGVVFSPVASGPRDPPMSTRMAILAELRYPTRWYSKLFTAALAIIFFGLLSTAAISAFLVYRVVAPPRSQPGISSSDFPGHPDTVTFTVPGMGSREGWFFPGFRGAPTIILCHGYTSNRGMLLTLASALQDHQYNVFLFDFAGHGSSGGYTTLGFRESQELRAAIDTLAQRNDVDPSRYGLWGTNLGAYAAIAEAETDRRVRAIVVDSVYDEPSQLVKMQIDRTGLGALPMVARWSYFGFRWLNYSYRKTPPLSEQMSRLQDVPKLFIQVLDEPRLAEVTQEMFVHAPEPREQAILPHGDYGNMLDDDKHAYETRIVNFFLLRLPPSARVIR